MSPVLAPVTCGVCNGPKWVVPQRRIVLGPGREILLVLLHSVFCRECDGPALEEAVARAAWVDLTPIGPP